MDKAGSCKGLDPTKVPQNGTCLWFNEGCTIGCPVCIGEKVKSGVSTCGRPGTATIFDDRYLTVFNVTIPWAKVLGFEKLPGHAHLSSFIDSVLLLIPTSLRPTWLPNPADPTSEHPWRAPGTAPVYSPCGLAGGSDEPDDGKGTGAWPPEGIEQGADGRNLSLAPGIHTVWESGSVQEVAWSMRANHGGGYSWRLCPRSTIISDMDEKCFQRQQLDFVGNISWIQYGETAVPRGRANRTAIPAVRVSEGTFPKGSMWTRNPVPECSGADGYGGAQVNPGCDKPMFPPPMDAEELPGVTQRGLYGYGPARCTSRLPGKTCNPVEYDFWARRFNFNLIDLVRVPELPPGNYLLALRIDNEQTPQVWSNCADVTIVDKAPSAVV